MNRTGPRRLAIVVAVGAIALLSLLGRPAGAGPLNTVEVVPGEGPPGTVIDVHNTPGETCGVAPNPGEVVEVRLVDLAGQALSVARTGTTPDGSWILPDGLPVPGGTEPGVYAVLATCDPDGAFFFYAAGQFTVAESVAPAIPPPSTSPTTTTTALDESAGTLDATAEPATGPPPAPTWPPSADITLLILFGTLLFIDALVLGRWIWLQVVDSGPRAATLLRATGWGAVIGALLFTASWLIAGLLQDDYSERFEYISALATPEAQDAWLMTVGFFVAGITLVVLAFAGHGTLRRCGVEALGPALLLGLAGSTLLDLAVLRSDCTRVSDACARAATSWHHDAHTIVGWITVLSLVAAAFWLARAYARVPVLRAEFSLMLPVAFLMLFGPVFLTEVFADNGLAQRIFLAAAALFIAFLGWQLTQAANGPRTVPDAAPADRGGEEGDGDG